MFGDLLLTISLDPLDSRLNLRGRAIDHVCLSSSLESHHTALCSATSLPQLLGALVFCHTAQWKSCFLSVLIHALEGNVLGTSNQSYGYHMDLYRFLIMKEFVRLYSLSYFICTKLLHGSNYRVTPIRW